MRYDRLRILLVDDNQHMRLILAMVLRAVGVREIFEADEGAAAMALLRDCQVDIVITDLAMPGLDGLAFVNLLRNSAESPSRMAPVIVITGNSTLTSVRQARDVGANEFLAKPITARGVLDRVQQVVDHPRPFIQSASYFGPDRRRRQDPDHTGPWRRAGDEEAQQFAAGAEADDA